jgi:hypothetical protein
MKKLFFLIAALSTFGFSQPYLTVGGGFSALFVKSDALTEFRDTYNSYNALGITEEMRGIGTGAFGLQGLIGFRHYTNLHFAINTGWQRHIIRDGASFVNDTERKLKYTFTNLFSEFELGKQIDEYFINGVLRLAFRREIEIESKHSARDTLNAASLDGIYQSPTLRAGYFGISTGVLRAPFLLNIKLLFPIYTGGDDSFIASDQAAKKVVGNEVFPQNFVEYATQSTYKGLHSDINGIILSFNFQLALSLNN